MKENKFQKNREKFIEGIDEEFQDLASQLKDIDFSKESNENSVLNTTLKNINIEGDNNMKKIKKTGIVAASLLIASTLVAQTTFAQEAVEKILKTISLGHVTMIQYDDNYSGNDQFKELIVADSLKGKVFDKNGNPLDKITKDISKDGIYTKSKEKINSIAIEGENILTKAEATKNEEDSEKNNLYVTDTSKLNDYTCFNVKLPTYLPEGYTFEKAEFNKDESGNVKDSKYIGLYFKNKTTGKEIYMQQRFACEDTKCVGGSQKVEKISINGADAILSDGSTLDWEANNTIYFLSGKNIGKDEAIKIAESIK